MVGVDISGFLLCGGRGYLGFDLSWEWTAGVLLCDGTCSVVRVDIWVFALWWGWMAGFWSCGGSG